MNLTYPGLDPEAPAEVRGETMLGTWRKLVGHYDLTRQAARDAIGDDAPAIVRDLVERGKRLTWLLSKTIPADCTCHIDGPDGMECWRCEAELALQGSLYALPSSVPEVNP